MSRDGDERPRRSWREIDQMRDRPGARRDERRPHGAHAEARAQRATRDYVKQLDALFAKGPGGAEGERLAKALRDAHGTPDLAAACAAYRDAVGLPRDPALLALFLDCGERELVLGALRALHELAAAGPWSSGLRRQLRMLVEDADDEIAEAAEAALGAAGAT